MIVIFYHKTNYLPLTTILTHRAPKKLPTQKYSRWKTNTFNKLRLLTEYANEHSDQNLTLADTLHITVNEMQDTYNVDLADYTTDYMLENSLETKPYALDVINYYKELRNVYTLAVDSIMDKLNLTISTPRNIFDQLAAQM